MGLKVSVRCDLLASFMGPLYRHGLVRHANPTPH